MRSTHAVNVPPMARSSGRRPPRWGVRLLAHMRGFWVDRQLADGVVSWQSPLHAARAVQLTTGRARRTLARSLEQLAERAEQPPTPFRGAAIPPCREQVRAALPLILAISGRLRSAEPVDARGIARLRGLLCDGGGPCYARIHPEALTIALQDASQWLDVSD